MGYVQAFGACFCCGQVFEFNPARVPSIRDRTGVRQPVCAGCMERANERRRAKGFEPFPVLAGAYEAADESSIDWGADE